MTTLDDVLVRFAGETTLTAADLEGLSTLAPADVALLMRTYEDCGKVHTRSFWERLAAELKTLEEYAPLASLLIAAIPLL